MADVMDIDLAAIFAGGTRVLSAGDGVPVVFVHGVGMNADIWREQLGWFARTNRAVAYDMLNHGSARSSVTARDGLQGYVDQLLDVADDLGLKSFHLVGHSMGALVATAFALAHPERVRTLAAMNAVWRRDAESSAAVLRRADELNDGLKTVSDENAIARWFGTPVPTGLAMSADLARNVLAAVEPQGYARSYNLFARSDRALEDALPTLAMPALFITGELDPNSTPAMSEDMARIAPQGDVVILKGERHMMSLTAPALVNEHLARHMLRGMDQ